MAVHRNYLDDDTYTEKDQMLIELAARGESQGNMAATTGFSVRQVQRKLSEPKFRKAIRKFCRDLFELRMRKLQGHWDKVEECFLGIVEDGNPFARLGAATQLKSMCFQARELDIEDEMDELRDQIKSIENRMTGNGAGVLVLENNQDAD